MSAVATTTEPAAFGTAESPPAKLPVGTFEKVATGISAAIIVGLIGVLASDAIRAHSDPSFSGHIGTVVFAGDSYRVPVRMQNTGDRSAKAVAVHLELRIADSVVAESDLVIDWLPGHSSRDAVAFFARNQSWPLTASVRAAVRGYVTP
jgi:uncharacterized protein (TIGR02588 family)